MADAEGELERERATPPDFGAGAEAAPQPLPASTSEEEAGTRAIASEGSPPTVSEARAGDGDERDSEVVAGFNSPEPPSERLHPVLVVAVLVVTAAVVAVLLLAAEHVVRL